MSREFPLGSPRSRGNSDVVLPRQFTDVLTAGVAVSIADANSGHPIVKLFNGSAFAGFSVSDIDQVTKTTGVIKTGEAVCLRVKEDAVLVVGEGFAVDNTTGELVPAGTDGSTTINGEVADIGVNGIDGFGEVIHGCALVNLYGGITLTGSGGTSGISDAPSDGSPYVRKDGAWVAEVTGVEEAPSDGTPYVRQDAGWVAETTQALEQQSATVKTTAKK